jgi:hypothetical protein
LPSASARFVKRAARVHRIPHPTSVTIAIRPSFGTGWRSSRFDLGQRRSGIFLKTGLDSKITDLPVGQNHWTRRWVEPFAKPITVQKGMGIASPHPSYAVDRWWGAARRAPLPTCRPSHRHCEERNRRSNPAFLWRYGLLRGACHRARIRATRWLAMTEEAQFTALLTTTSISFVPGLLNADDKADFSSPASVIRSASSPRDFARPVKSTGGSTKSMPT